MLLINYSEVAVNSMCTGKQVPRDVNDLLKSQMGSEWQWGGGHESH